MKSDYKMSFDEFLHTVRVIKMLYGREVAEKFFTKNLPLWYNLDSASLIKFEKGS